MHGREDELGRRREDRGPFSVCSAFCGLCAFALLLDLGGENTSALIGRAKNHRATCMMSGSGCPDYDEVELDHDVLSPILQEQADHT